MGSFYDVSSSLFACMMLFSRRKKVIIPNTWRVSLAVRRKFMRFQVRIHIFLLFDFNWTLTLEQRRREKLIFKAEEIETR